MKRDECRILAVRTRRAPHGARGLKLLMQHINQTVVSRAPHGARGLKHTWAELNEHAVRSRPARGAWIETGGITLWQRRQRVAPRTGRVD